MRSSGARPAVVFFLVAALAILSEGVGAEMRIHTMDGRVFTLPVERQNIRSIEFSDGGSSPLPGGLISYWKFDEPGGDRAQDSVGDNHGIIRGASRTEGRVGRALSFDGGSAHVLFRKAFPLHQAGDVTLMFWMNRADDTHRSVFWTRADDQDANRFNIFSGWLSWGGSGGGIGFDYRTASGSLHSLVAAQTPANQWVHVALTRAGNQYTLYVDGKSVHQAQDGQPSLPTHLGEWAIGRRGCCMYRGLIDEVAIYGRTLAASEVQQLYQASTQGIAYDGTRR